MSPTRSRKVTVARHAKQSSEPRRCRPAGQADTAEGWTSACAPIFGPMSVVTGDEFRGWMAPKVAGIRRFVGAVDSVNATRSLPNPESRAMEELAAEPSFRSRSTWEQPIADCHTFGSMTLRAAADYLRAFAELFDGTQPPVYAHLAVARSAFESAVVCEWLSEPGIGPLDRVKRGLCEQLYSAAEVDALGLMPNAPPRVDQWTAVADAFGWRANVSRSRPIIDGTKRPRVSDGIVRLARSDEGSLVGDLMFSRLSAVSHVTWFGLQYALNLSEVETDALSRLGTVAIGTDGVRVSELGFYLLRVVRNAAAARFTLMGWTGPEWADAQRDAIELETVFAKTVLRAGDSR
jgi:hypothetical protein